MKAAPGHDHGWRAVTEDVFEFDRTHQRGQRDHGGPGPQGTVVDHREVRHVGHHEGDSMSGPHALPGEQSSALLGQVVEHLDRHRELAASKRDALRVGGGRARQDLGNVEHPRYLLL